MKHYTKPMLLCLDKAMNSDHVSLKEKFSDLKGVAVD
jgi:hypothetical protein